MIKNHINDGHLQGTLTIHEKTAICRLFLKLKKHRDLPPLPSPHWCFKIKYVSIYLLVVDFALFVN